MLGYGAAQKFLRTESSEERFELQALAVAARAIQQDHDLERARMTAAEVARRLFGDG